MSQEVTIHANITPIGEFQLKEFSSIVFLDEKDLICGSHDGRIFQIDPNTYTIKRSFFLHSSWISTLFINEKYFVTGSYDMNIMVCYSNEIYDYSKSPKFSRFSEHSDYILSIAVCGDILISSSSEPLILLSKIDDKKNIKSFKSIRLNISVHAISFHSDDQILFGTIDGKILTTSINSKDDPTEIISNEEPIKILSINSPYLASGCLDGSILLFKIKYCDISNQKESHSNQRDVHSKKIEYNFIEKIKFDSRIVSIIPYKEKFIIFTEKGNIYDLNESKCLQIETGKPISFGSMMLLSNSQKNQKSKTNLFFHIATSDGVLFCINSENEILFKVSSDVYYKKAIRIPQTSTNLLCKNSRKEVILFDLKTFEVQQNFGYVSFKSKLKELSKSPSYQLPVSFDVSCGYVKIIIPPILPTLLQANMKNQKEKLTDIIKKLIEKKVMIFALDKNGKTIWNNYSNESVPYWFKYLIDPKFNQV